MIACPVQIAQSANPSMVKEFTEMPFQGMRAMTSATDAVSFLA